jgi:hypothetical protein
MRWRQLPVPGRHPGRRRRRRTCRRRCRWPGAVVAPSRNAGSPRSPPRDPLETGVDRAVRLLRRLDPRERSGSSALEDRGSKLGPRALAARGRDAPGCVGAVGSRRSIPRRRRSRIATPRSWRRSSFTFQDTPTSDVLASNRSWLNGLWSALRPSASGAAYVNYIDPALKDWQLAYYGSNLDRLIEGEADLRPGRRVHVRAEHPDVVVTNATQVRTLFACVPA